MVSSMRGGGSERQTLLMLRHLDRSRFSPELYVTERAGRLLDAVPEDVPVHSFDELEPSGGMYFPGKVLRRQIQHLRELLIQRSIDVIYDRTFHMTLIAGPAAQDVGIPRVSTIVSPPEHALPLVESRFVGLKRRRLATAYGQSRHVIAVSQQAADSARRYYGLSLVDVIHNPVDIEQLELDARGPIPFERALGLNLVCVGRMTEEKGHRDLIQALQKSEQTWPETLSPLNVWMIGNGPLKSDLQDQWGDSPHRHRVDFVGTQTNPAPAIAAARCACFAFSLRGAAERCLGGHGSGYPCHRDARWRHRRTRTTGIDSAVGSATGSIVPRVSTERVCRRPRFCC